MRLLARSDADINMKSDVRARDLHSEQVFVGLALKLTASVGVGNCTYALMIRHVRANVAALGSDSCAADLAIFKMHFRRRP